MGNQLLLLTKTYPFGRGEEFIENEIGFLAEAFDTVVVLATAVTPDLSQTREVPKNVHVERVSTLHPKHVLLKEMVFSKTIATLKDRRDDHDLTAAAGDIRHRLFFRYFVARAAITERAISALVKRGVLDGQAQTTLYSYWLHDIAAGALLGKRHFSGNTEVISRAHNYDLYEEASSVGYLPLRTWLLDALDCVYTCSDNGKDYLHNRYPNAPSHIKTAYLGTRDRGLGPIPGKDEIAHIVSCSYLSSAKRINRIIDALAQLENNLDRPVHWTHFGGGELQSDLESQAHDLLDFMTFSFRGAVANSELMDFYATNPVDLFLSASTREGIPVSMMEAASFGIPIVATDVGGVGEIIVEDSTGYLLPVDFDTGALTDRIVSVLTTQDDDYGMLRRNARVKWEQDFDAARNYAQFAEEISHQDR